MSSFDMLKRKSRLVFSVSVFIAYAVSTAADAAPNAIAFHPLTFQSATGGTYTAQHNGFVFTLSNPDDAQHPQAWDSALSIAHSATSSKCSTDPLLIQHAYASSRDTVLVVHFSGSMTYVDLIDTKTCKARSPRLEAMTDSVVVKDARVEIWPGCEPIDATVSNCSSAKVFQYNDKFTRSEIPDASDALTKQVIGVAFKGIKKVRHAKTGKAQVVK